MEPQNSKLQEPVDTGQNFSPISVPDSIQTPQSKTKIPVMIIIVGLFIILSVSVSAYIINKNMSLKNKPTTTPTKAIISSPTSLPNITPLPTAPKELNWITKTITLNKETEVSGKESIQILFEIPDTWQIDINYEQPNPDFLYKECPIINLTDGQNKVKPNLTIKPICSGWSATYSDKTPDDKIITEDSEKVIIRRGLMGNDGPEIIYGYYGFDGTKASDAIMITYDKSNGQFIPFNISLESYIESSSISKSNDKYIIIPDQIVKSIRAQLE